MTWDPAPRRKRLRRRGYDQAFRLAHEAWRASLA